MGNVGRATSPVAYNENQKEILKIVLAGNRDGSFVDLDQLLERLNDKKPKTSSEITKPAIQHRLRPLVRRGLVEKRDREYRRGASRRIIAPTMYAYKLMKS